MLDVNRDSAESILSQLADIPFDVNSLNDKQFDYLTRMLDDIASHGDSILIDQLYQADFWRKPPTIQEFIEDEYFMGSITTKDDEVGQSGIFPCWRETLYDIYDPARKSPVNQFILSGSIGGGKTFTGVLALLYKVARCLCMRNPLLYYRINKVTSLNFSFLSITKAQIQGGAWQDCVNMMGISPFFQEHTPTGTINKSASKMVLANNIIIEAGSKARHAIGRNTLASLMDEVNFRLEKEANKAAKEMFDTIQRRAKSRFRHSSETMVILISSASKESDFLAQHMKKNRNNPTVKICDYPYWQTAGPTKITYAGEMFPVDIGDTVHRSKILDTKNPQDLEDIESVKQIGRLLMVPTEHFEEFDDDLDGALKDVAGIGLSRSVKYFNNHLRLFDTLRDDVVNPFEQERIRLSIGNQHEISDFLNIDKMVSRLDRYRPIRHAYAPRFVHMDMATGAQDNFGLVMVHPVYNMNVEFIDRATHLKDMKMSPYFEVDFAVAIGRDSSGEPVDFGKIRKFMLWLRAHGYKIAKITCDLDSMSIEMRNILKQNGFDAEYLSVDKKKDPYATLRQVVSEGRLGCFNHQLMYSELANVEDMGKKIDHPENNSVYWCGQLIEKGSKDMADGLAGAIYTAESHADSYVLPQTDTIIDRMAAAMTNNTQGTLVQAPRDSIPVL